MTSFRRSPWAVVVAAVRRVVGARGCASLPGAAGAHGVPEQRAPKTASHRKPFSASRVELANLCNPYSEVNPQHCDCSMHADIPVVRGSVVRGL